MADEPGHGASQTQQELKNLVTDIFGDSDEEKDVPTSKPKSTTDYEVNIFGDSDDEEEQPKTAKKKEIEDIFGDSDEEAEQPVRTVSKAKDTDNLVDSDEENESYQRQPSRKKEGKGKKRKLKGSKKIPKRKKSVDREAVRRDDGERESGDEYDSGEEAPVTAADQDFIDKDDDENADLMKEYEEDNQDFGDERPDDYGSSNYKSSKSSSSNNYNSERVSMGANETDPMSMALKGMKRPKTRQMSDSEKDIFIDKLQKKMSDAVAMDNECFLRKEPAIYKVQLLPKVQTALSMKHMQQMMLDKDILCFLRDWIEPRDATTLPALSVRTAIYEILLRLNCSPEHLKRVLNEKPPIGVTIVSLRRHKMETAANKRILKEVMEKWSRPIFGKQSDERARGSGGLQNDTTEVRESLRQRDEEEKAEIAGRMAGGNQGELDAVLSGQAQTAVAKNAEFNRARVPYSKGFLFTQQPQLKEIDKQDVREKSMGEGRNKLFKRMTEKGAQAGGLGKKAVTRATDMRVSGRITCD